MGAVDNDIQQQVREAYSAAAREPSEEHPFPVGRPFAENAGYPAELLDSLPPVCFEAFCGASNVSVFAELHEGAKVLDLGCGAGLDSLIGARQVGHSGCVIGTDFSDAMLDRAGQAGERAGAANVSFRRSEGGALPFADGEFDCAMVNGIFNLNPARESIMAELARVLRPGGRAYVAELIRRVGPGPLRWATRKLADRQSASSDWFA